MLVAAWFLCVFQLFMTQNEGLASSFSFKIKKEKGMSAEKSLINEILERYEYVGKIGRPAKTKHDVININFGLALIQLLDLDENKQMLRTNCWLRMFWHDYLLNWKELNDTQYNTIDQIRVLPDQIWTPDIKLYNFADERLVERREARVVVFSNGDVLWIPQALFKSTCPVDITYFPFDSQICEMDFGSWTYDSSQLNLKWWFDNSSEKKEVPYIDFNDYLPSNEWYTDGEIGSQNDRSDKPRRYQIASVKYYRTANRLPLNKHSPNRQYVMLKYRLRISRNPTFFVSILIIPCVLLSCMTLVLFWLPPESPAKMMLGMNIFVAFFVLLLLLAESTPSAVKNFPLIGSYYCLNMILITLSTFLAELVINLYFQGDQKGPVPKYFRKIIIEGMGRLLLVRQNIPLPDERKLISAIVGEVLPSSRKNGGHLAISIFGKNFLAHENLKSYKKLTYEEFKRRQKRKNINYVEQFEEQHKKNSFQQLKAENINTNKNHCMENDVREIKRYIRIFLSRQKNFDARNQLAMEWRTMALVLDRMFFVIYVVAILVALLTMVPRRMPNQLPFNNTVNYKNFN